MINEYQPGSSSSSEADSSRPNQLPEDGSRIGKVASEAARRLFINENLVAPPENLPTSPLNLAEFYESYLGVCDVYSPDESKAMADELREARNSPNRKVMIGVMTHPFVLSDDVPVPVDVRDGVRRVFPTKEEMSRGFIDDPDVFNTVHYADLYGPNGPRKANEAPDVQKNLDLIAQYGGDNLHAIQLDLTWPNVDDLKSFKEAHPELDLILQVGKFALSEVDNNISKVIKKLLAYGEAVDYALLDTSMGMGNGMESNSLLPMLRTIRHEIPDLGLAVAGGLGPDTLDLLKPIAAEFPDISLDAQGNLKLKDAPKDELGHYIPVHPADLGRSIDYIRKSCKILDRK